ncbi:MAG: AraC family transcriptional regulator [Nannocystaceae bacterium]|nr:AraC family transcriptional regulator [Nannocystaceae bacterium]
MGDGDTARPRRASSGLREHAPPAALAPYVDRTWTRAAPGPGPARSHLVLPDGCCDFIVALGPEPVGFVVGPMTRAQSVAPRAGAYVGVRLQPAAAAALLRERADALVDARVELDAWWRDWPALVEAMARDADGGVARMLARVRTSVASAPPLDREIAHAVARLREPGAPDVAELARELGRSRQHLTRRFREQVGLAPKAFARIARLQRLVAAMASTPPRWAALAAEHGYADQAHLAHEFAGLVGLTPSAWWAGSNSTSPAAPRRASSAA